MTDNEIIQALNYCCGNITWEDDAECAEDKCYQCALPEDRDGDTRWCRQWLMKDALDLINRQKAEIERYEKTVGKLITNDDGNAFAILNGNKTEYITKKAANIFKNMAVNNAKSEAIKEVFEKLDDKSIVCKVKLYGKRKFYPCLSAVTLHDINKLKKEMME